MSRWIVTIGIAGLVLSTLYGVSNAGPVTRCSIKLKDGRTLTGMLEMEPSRNKLRITPADGREEFFRLEDVGELKTEVIQAEDGRSPVFSCALSFFLPGAGQYYNGQTTKGAVIDAACLTGLVAAGFSSFDGPKDQGMYDLGIGLFLAGYIFGIVDAPVSSILIDDERHRRIYGETTVLSERVPKTSANLGIKTGIRF